MQHDTPQKLLVVEDNPGDAQTIKRSLKSASSQSYTMVQVERLNEALSYLEKEQFAVILLDLSLPDSWGLDTIKQVQTRAPQTPIVVMTGLDDEDVAIKAVQEGAQDYLVKGRVDSYTLKRALRYAVERHRLRQELQTSEARYYNLFENASDALFSFTSEGILTDVNHELEVLLEYSREELLQQSYQHLLTPASAVLLKERVQRLLSGEPASQLSPVLELEAVRKDSTIIPIEIRATLLHDLQAQPSGVFVMARDISVRKALERQRTEFLAMLTHDIKNPLAALIGYTDYLQDATQRGDFASHAEVLPRMKSNAFTILSLVNNYLDLSRIEDKHLTLTKEPLNLNDVLTRIGQQYEGEARHRAITFVWQLHQPPLWVEGDRLALERIFTNLIHNALKFTPKQGRITISSFLEQAEIVVTVADTGPGIVAEEAPLLFEKYRRSLGARRAEGMGLGLFIVHTLVVAHMGKVEVSNAPGGGACFRISLPIKTLEQPRGENSPLQAES